MQILNKLKQADLDDKKHLVRLERTFEHRGHLCLVFEALRYALSSILSARGSGDISLTCCICSLL